jgi:hypothetical protein
MTGPAHRAIGPGLPVRLIISLALASMVVFIASPVMAVAPQPVVAIDPDGNQGTGGNDAADGGDASGEGDPSVPPEQDCLNVAGQVTTSGVGTVAVGSVAVGTRVPSTTASGTGVPGLPTPRASYPGPVVAVPPEPRPWPTNCSADLSMLLVIRSPDERRPQDVDAFMDELAIPQAALESMFEVRVPAQTRTILLARPTDEWELTGLRCDCIGTQQQASAPRPRLTLGGVAATVRTTQPQPVVAVESSGPVPGGCIGISSSAGARGSEPLIMSGRHGQASLTYPQPVVPVEPGSQPWSPLPRQPASVSWDRDGTVRIDDPDGAGGTFHCVWTVELMQGTFSLTTETEPPGEEDRFTYQLTPAVLHPRAQPFTMQADPTGTEDLRRGEWTAALRDLPEGWSVKESTCRERGTELVTTAGGAQARLGIDPGDRVDCTFKLGLLAPQQGPWKADNKQGTVACSVGRLKLPATRDRGRLIVRQDGDVLEGRGIGQGKGSFRVERDRDDPLVYRGTLNLGVSGTTVRTQVTLRMESARELTGNLRASFQERGVKCTLSRKVVLTYAGGD